MAIPIQNASDTTYNASDLDQTCLKTCSSKDRCTFPLNIFAPIPKITPKHHFGGPSGAKPIIQRALRKSHINGATKLKLYSYIGIGKYLRVYKNFSARGIWGVQGPKSKFGTPPIISETTRARKLNLKLPLDMVKYPLWIEKLLLYDTTWGRPPYWFSTNVYISEADYG